MTTPCPVCTGLVPTVDGNLILHRHRDQLGPCPAGQVPDPGVDVGEALAGAEAYARGLAHSWRELGGGVQLAAVMAEYDRRAVRIEELEAERDEALTAKLWALRAVGSASARLAVVGPALDAARALVAEYNPSAQDGSDTAADNEHLLDTLAARVRELEEA